MAAKKDIDLPNVVALAIAKLFGEKEVKAVRNEVGANPDGYELDVNVRIKGKLKVFHDYNAENAQRLCPWRLFQIALNKLNTATQDALVEQIMAEYEAGTAPDLDELKKKTAKAAAKVLRKTDGIAKGQVKFEGLVEESAAR